MPYKPTNKPPGRPPAKPKPVEPEVIVYDGPLDPARLFDRRDPADNGLVCPQCYPDLVGRRDWHAASCKHGSYFCAR
jgi:hypothetical protein